MNGEPAFFDGFEIETLGLETGDVRLRRGGTDNASTLILLHGNPQTHAMWHAVAPALAQHYHVICPDLRGYGQSHKPPVSADSRAYGKVAMARDIIAVMDHFEIESAQIAGHDRGARVAHRLALDYPQRVERLALLDIIPTLEHFERTDMQFAMRYYHWFWLAQKHPLPEQLINQAPVDWFWGHTSREPKDKSFFHPQALQDYLESVCNPAMITGMCEDYRAAAGIDLIDDRAARDQGQKISCDLLALWGSKGIIGKLYDPISIWQSYCAASVSGKAISSGHYLAEESPEEVLSAFLNFFVR